MSESRAARNDFNLRKGALAPRGERAPLRGATGILSSFYSLDVHVPVKQAAIFDVYAIDHEPPTHPFITKVELKGTTGQSVSVTAFIDDGAMVAAMDTRVYGRVKGSLMGWRKSGRRLRMANGAIVSASASWRGHMLFGGLRRLITFEVFDSGGSWEFLFGKPLLERFGAVHDYTEDVLLLRVPGQGLNIIRNDLRAKATTSELVGGTDSFADVPPPREVHEISIEEHTDPAKPGDTASEIKEDEWFDAEEGNDTLWENKSSSVVPDDAEAKPDNIRGGVDITPKTPPPRRFGCTECQKRKQEAEQERQRVRLAQRQRGRIEAEERLVQVRKELAQEFWRGILVARARRRFWWRTKGLIDPNVLKEIRQKAKEASRASSEGGSHAPPPREDHSTPQVCIVEDSLDFDSGSLGAELLADGNPEKKSLYTRNDGPDSAFRPARVAEVLRTITIGDDLSASEHAEVEAVITEYADCFALFVSEVRLVEGAVHKLDIPDDAVFLKKVRQRALTPPQREYLHLKIEELLEAGVIEQCHPSEVKCVSPITLAQKAHEGKGLSLKELQHRVNDQCVEAGLPPCFDLPPRTTPQDNAPTSASQPTKWRICQNYSEINKVTQIAPMPQGDMRAKQQRLSGKRYLTLFDFASGFYACEVEHESRPYTAFYVEGRGYFWQKRMPFGLTGAPSTFGHLTATSLHDLVADGTIELFVDDGGSASDTFEEGMTKLCRLLERVRQTGLSISAAKSEFFVTEDIFAGARVGPNGVQPDPAKLTAIVDWPQPPTGLNLASFLGLTGHFRDLIKGYALIKGPLRELLKSAPLPTKYTKTVYHRVMESFKLQTVWTEQHTKSFLELKRVLTSEPVLCSPMWDGSHFIVTTDGCQEGLAGVLTQRQKVTLPSGKVVNRVVPLAFASKRTSASERNYKPFLLEFAALKFSLDKFSDMIWGYPVEVETDCQALRDVLVSEKLNASHARWRDGILAHAIVDVRHVPGRTNVVADGLSRSWEGTPRAPGDGSEWTVSEDWESAHGIINDIMGVAVEESDTYALLCNRFREEPVFLEVVEAISNQQTSGTLRAKQRARHRAKGYEISEGKLWRIGAMGPRARARVECVTKAEAVELARIEHEQHGHWGRDAVKQALLDKIWSPKLDASILRAISLCGRCKSFGGAHLRSLLEPVTRRHPFKLLVADYLSMPKGKGGFQTVLLMLDVFSQHVWGYKYKTKGSAKTTIDGLRPVFHNFIPPEALMTDGGSHFNNEDVREFCRKYGAKAVVTSAYSPWVNGLVEGTNKLLLHVLKRLCAPELGDDLPADYTWESLPELWPEKLEEAIWLLNTRILPKLCYTPKELLLGRPVNTPPTPIDESTSILRDADADANIAYVAQQHLNGYDSLIRHAIRRKAAFDRRESGWSVVFKEGQLVQVYRSQLTYTMSTEKKLARMWSNPYRVKERVLNSYKLQTIDGRDVDGLFSTRRLRPFIPKDGSVLARDQEVFEAGMREQVVGEDAASL